MQANIDIKIILQTFQLEIFLIELSSLFKCIYLVYLIL